MQDQKSQATETHGGGWFRWELKFLGIFLALISFSNLIFSNKTFALYTPTLSASVDKSDITVSGNDVIRFDKTSFNLLTLIVKTNNRTGYTASISSETNDTSLKNLESISGAKIESIAEDLPLGDFTANTWGYKMWSENTFKPIPPVSSPVNIIQTTEGTGYNASELRTINFAMKLGDTLESGSYTNKMIISVVANPYEKKARINRGYDFNTSVGNLDKNQTVIDGKGKRDNIYRIKRSSIAKDLIPADAVNIENGSTSDYEVKIWFVPSENTVYYWTEADKITLSKDSSFMFDRMPKLQTIDLSGFDTSEAENMARMFSNSPELKSLDFSGFNTGKVKDFTYTFYDAKNIESLDLSMFDTSSATTMYGMFNGMTALKNLNISSFNTRNVTEMQEMFQYNSSLTSLDLSRFDTRKVTSMKSMFYNLSNVTSLDLSSFDTRNVKQMDNMFQGVSKVPTLRLNNFNTEKVENMSGMFAYMDELEDLDVSSFDTRKVTNMYGMFSGVKKLRSINVSNFNTSAVTNMGYMFRNMAALENLDINNFNTSAVTNMNNMFSGMTNLRSLNLSNFDTVNVKDMGGMFHNMKTITELNLSNFNTSNVLGMEAMFYNMTALKTLDISNFDTSQVGSVKSIFATADGDNLERIYVNNDFNTACLTSYMDYTNMFTGRTKLRGGNGSYLFDPASADLTWLRVDRPGVQGYFTRKS